MSIPTGTAVGGITSAHSQKCCRTSKKPDFSGVFQQTISSPKTQQQVATYPGSEQTESFPQGGEIQDRNTGNHQDVPPTRGVGHLNKFQGRLLPYTNTGTVQEISEISESLVRICPKLGWLVNLEKSELVPKQIFDFVGYQFDLRAGRVRPTPDRWQNLQDKIFEIMSLPHCPVRQFMSLIGLLTATEKQVHLGRLHMRPIQWHLKQHWRIPESLEKVIPIPSSLHPHLQWWLQEDNVLTGQPLHPIKHALQIFTEASKEGWGAHLNEFTARGTWSLPESKLHINYLELKAVFLALKEF